MDSRLIHDLQSMPVKVTDLQAAVILADDGRKSGVYFQF